MNSELARKYLSGEISIQDVSQATDSNDNTPPEEQPSGDAGSEDKGGTEEVHTEQVDAPGAEDDASKGGIATQPTDGNPKTTSNEEHDNASKGKTKDKLPYPNATKDDVEKYKANRSFIKQKEKFKAKMKAYEAEIESLKAKLMKAEAVDPKSFEDDVDKQVDFKVAKGMLKNRIEGLEAQRQSAIYDQEEAECEQIHQQRVDSCFDDEESKSHYQRLLENGRDKFVEFLGKYDPDNTILSYLDDSNISPLMVQVLMTNPEVLKRVVSIKNPLNKVIELRSLESRINLDRKLRSVKTPRNDSQPQDAKSNHAGKLPSTGSQTQAGAGKDPNPVRDSAYWHNYLATH